MSLKIGNNGVLRCNTVRYNWKQARNMIADGSGGNISTSWTFNNAKFDTIRGYKSYRCYAVNAGGTMSQKLPKLYANRKYYLSLRVYNGDAIANGAVRILNANQDNLGQIYLGKNYNKWTLASKIIEITSDVDNATINVITYGTAISVCRFIMVDLTDTFGQGNEPTKDWCDNNIREQETIINYGCRSTNISQDNYNDRWVANIENQPITVHKYNYLELDSNWEPREYMYGLIANTQTNNGGGFVSSDSYDFEKNAKLYFYIEALCGQNLLNRWVTFNFPINKTFNIGTSAQTIANGNRFSGGGGMSDWKRLSCYGANNSVESGKYQGKIYINNNKLDDWIRVTAINIMNPTTSVTIYNQSYGTNIHVDDINKEWCDRWIDARSSPIIHIKDPNNTTIKFNPAKKVNRSEVYSYTRETLNSYLTLRNDTWTTNADNSHLRPGDFAYFDILISDEDNKKARFFVEILEVNSNNLVVNNLYYYDINQSGYNNINSVDIQCNDIVIRPELTTVKFDHTTGTIYCSKLEREADY